MWLDWPRYPVPMVFYRPFRHSIQLEYPMGLPAAFSLGIWSNIPISQRLGPKIFVVCHDFGRCCDCILDFGMAVFSSQHIVPDSTHYSSDQFSLLQFGTI